MRVYNPGDVFVDQKLGVITILEILPHHQVKCKIYDKQNVSDSVKVYSAAHLDLFIDYNSYKFYPVKE